MELSEFKFSFCCLTFLAKERSNEICGSNGLPLTPNSIKILGKAQFLKTLHHPNLCSYIDILRSKHERTIVVSEQSGIPLSEYEFKDWKETLHFARSILEALAYLHDKGVVHRNLSRDNIFLSNGTWKLFNYGLYYMTDNGIDVQFPIGCLKYLSPDVLFHGPLHKSSSKCDIWSLGVILAEIVLGCHLWNNLAKKNVMINLMSFIASNNVLKKIAEDANKLSLYEKLPPELKDLVESMLAVDSTERPNATFLLNKPIFVVLDFESQRSCWKRNYEFVNLNNEAMIELYHYWQLAGGDVYNELKKNSLIRNKPPILNLPNLLILEGTYFGQQKDKLSVSDQNVIKISTKQIIDRFKNISKTNFDPMRKSSVSSIELCETSSLPLLIKERDTEYQFLRLQLFRKLLMECPEKKGVIVKEARLDIPPLIRAKVWGHILMVSSNYAEEYAVIDKETPVPTDRQIEVDIPRCHQYNELLSSSVGHLKFKHILKAWVESHSQYVYWQGLDSLCAPFLFLNFLDEAYAYASLTKFIDKYLHNFFLKDNSAVIREYLAKLKHLLAFQDPILASHLDDIGFSPELFAIPWFLTMFSHVFPIHKILHLWDSLLLGDASYPIYIGLSILQQLRHILLESGFNECILLFSDLPEIDIEKCVKDSIFYYCGTPGSVTYRQHDPSQANSKGMDGILVTLKELQNEMSPRLSSQELKRLVLKPSLRTKILIVDIRDSVQYKTLNLIGSINIPFESIGLNSKNTKLDKASNFKSELNILQSHKGKIIVVASNNMETASEFCKILVHLGVPKVCSLHGGIGALASSDIIR